MALNFEHDPTGGHTPLTIDGTAKILARFNVAEDNVEDSSAAEYYNASQGRLILVTGNDIIHAPNGSFTGNRLLLQTDYNGGTGFGNIRALSSDGTIWIQANTLSGGLAEDAFFLLNSVGKSFAIVIAHQDAGTKDMQFSGDLATQTFTFSQSGVTEVILRTNETMQLKASNGKIQALQSSIQHTYNPAPITNGVAALTLPPAYGNAFTVNGDGGTDIEKINTTNWQQGSIISLIFTASSTIIDGAGSSGNDIQIGLNNENTHNFVADEQLTLILAGDYWLEIGRRIKPAPLPNIIFTVNENYDYFQYDNDGSDVIIDWGDGSPLETFTGATNQPAHTYTDPGSYQIKVYNNAITIFQIAPDDIGCNDQYLESVEQLCSSIVTCLISFNQNVTSIDATELTGCTLFDGSYQPLLTSFDASTMSSCTSFNLVNCATLATVNTSGLSNCDIFQVTNNAELITCDFSPLTSCTNFIFTDNILFDQSVDFTSLTNCTAFRFSGNSAFDQTVDFSALTNCTDFFFGGSNVFNQTLDFSALTNCTDFLFGGLNVFNQTLDFSALTNCTHFLFAENNLFDQIVDFSVLTNCISFEFYENLTFDQIVDFSALTNCTDFIFSDNTAFTQPLDINLASIATLEITGNTSLDTLNIDGCTGITTLDLTGTAAITDFSADGCTLLTSIDTANLTACTSFNAPNNPALATLDLTPMVNVVSVQVYNCDSLAALDTTGLTACIQLQCNNSAALATLDCAGLSSCVIFDARNCILDVTNVNNALIDLAGFGTLNGDCKIENQTPSAAPTGAGITAKATLITNGWTVTTD